MGCHLSLVRSREMVASVVTHRRSGPASHQMLNLFLAGTSVGGFGIGNHLDCRLGSRPLITVDALGAVYAMDTRNQRVQVFRVELP